jgi:peptide/nickel transport system substrate-binding protein
METTRAPFDDLKVRQAVADAIDYKAISSGVLRGYGSAPNGILPPNIGHFAPPSLAYPSTNLDQARSLMASSHVKGPVTVNLIYDSGQPLDALMAQVIQSDLGKIGIQVRLDGMETGAFVGQAFGLKSDLVLWSYGAISPDGIDPISWILGTSWLFTGFPTKSLEAASVAYNSTTSDAKKEQIFAGIQDANIKDLQAIALSQFQILEGVQSNVHGFAAAPWGLYYYDPIWLGA